MGRASSFEDFKNMDAALNKEKEQVKSEWTLSRNKFL
jgi:hypothetical protein